MARDRGLKLIQGAHPMLGAFIGTNQQLLDQWSQQHIDSHADIYRAVSHKKMPAQHALLLLRNVALARSSYFIRTTDPALISDTLKALDHNILDTVIKKLRLNLRLSANPPRPGSRDDLAIKQLRQPVKHGGLGLRSFTTLAPLAFLASMTQAMRVLFPWRQSFLQVGRSIVASEDNSSFSASIESCRASAVSMGAEVTAVFPSSTPALWQTYKAAPPTRRLQHLLTLQVEQSQLSSLMASADARSKARLLSAAGYGAGRWLTTIPASKELSLTDDIFSLAVSHLLDLRFRADMMCACGTRVSEFHHFHVCKKLRRTAVTTRHNLLVHRLAKICTSAGHATVVEPIMQEDDPAPEVRDYSSANLHSRRPDLSTASYNGLLFIDVSVTHPLADSYVRQAQKKPLHAAERRAAEKRSKYLRMAQDLSADFSPFVLESYGAMGKGTQQLLKSMAHDGSAYSAIPHASFLANSVASISVGLQLGNAHGNVRYECVSGIKISWCQSHSAAVRQVRP